MTKFVFSTVFFHVIFVFFSLTDDRSIIDDRDGTKDENEDDSDATVQSLYNEESAEKCFFCNKIVITRNYNKVFCRRIKDKQSCLSTLKKYATEMNDFDMLQKVMKKMLTQGKV